jgi:hypothetical protein
MLRAEARRRATMKGAVLKFTAVAGSIGIEDEE